MTDAGFFRGTSSEQDNRFSDKEKKLLKQMKFNEIILKKVDMSKIRFEVIKPWISNRIIELLGMEDDVLVEFVINQLEANNNPDGRKIQINLTGFLNGKNARIFTAELWELLTQAQDNAAGIPDALIESKKDEIKKRIEEIKKEKKSPSPPPFRAKRSPPSFPKRSRSRSVDKNKRQYRRKRSSSGSSSRSSSPAPHHTTSTKKSRERSRSRSRDDRRPPSYGIRPPPARSGNSYHRPPGRSRTKSPTPKEDEFGRVIASSKSTRRKSPPQLKSSNRYFNKQPSTSPSPPPRRRRPQSPPPSNRRRSRSPPNRQRSRSPPSHVRGDEHDRRWGESREVNRDRGGRDNNRDRDSNNSYNRKNDEPPKRYRDLEDNTTSSSTKRMIERLIVPINEDRDSRDRANGSNKDKKKVISREYDSASDNDGNSAQEEQPPKRQRTASSGSNNSSVSKKKKKKKDKKHKKEKKSKKSKKSKKKKGSSDEDGSSHSEDQEGPAIGASLFKEVPTEDFEKKLREEAIKSMKKANKNL